jgi:hypothetical protein
MTAFHLGDPCIHCGVGHDSVAAGPCDKAVGVGARIRNSLYWKSLLENHTKAAAAESARLTSLIKQEDTAIFQSELSLDLSLISLAESVMRVGDYSNGGDERNGARVDAMKWFATGHAGYLGLKREYFGTKNYAKWGGQRCDCEYGMGPRHGSICFSIGLREEARKRDLTNAEKEACIYYLLNLENIQKAQAKASL